MKDWPRPALSVLFLVPKVDRDAEIELMYYRQYCRSSNKLVSRSISAQLAFSRSLVRIQVEQFFLQFVSAPFVVIEAVATRHISLYWRLGREYHCLNSHSFGASVSLK